MTLVWIPSVAVDDGIRNFVMGGLDRWAAVKSCCLTGRLSAETAFAGGIDIAAAAAAVSSAPAEESLPVGVAVGVVPFRSTSA